MPECQRLWAPRSGFFRLSIRQELGSTDGLDEDRSNPNNQRAVDAAGEFVREHHSWRRRAEQVFDHLANGAAIDIRSMQDERQLGRTVSRVALPQDLPQELRATERFG